MNTRHLRTLLSLLALAAPALQLSAQNPLAALENAAKEKAAEAAIETLPNNQLPLILNAKDVYPTVTTLPGGPFSPAPLQLTADQLNQPLAPGDYTINTLGYFQGRGAQALGQVPVVSQNPAPEPSSTPIGVAQTATQGPVTVIHAGTTTPVPLEPGDTIGINDTIQTGPGAKASILFDDNTEFTLGENTKLKVDDYVYDPDGNSNKASYRFLEGVFQYVGGLIEKKDPAGVRINTPFVGVGIRGTEFIAKVNPAGNSLEVDLISGAITLTPNGSTAAGPTTSAPAQIEVTPQGTKVLPLTQDQYDTLEGQLTPATPTS